MGFRDQLHERQGGFQVGVLGFLLEALLRFAVDLGIGALSGVSRCIIRVRLPAWLKTMERPSESFSSLGVINDN